MATPKGTEFTIALLYSAGVIFSAAATFCRRPATLDEAPCLLGIQRASPIFLSSGEASSNFGGEGVISLGLSGFLYSYTGVARILASIAGVSCDGEIQVRGVRGVWGIGGDPPVWYSGVITFLVSPVRLCGVVITFVSLVGRSAVATLGEAISVSSSMAEAKDMGLTRL